VDYSHSRNTHFPLNQVDCTANVTNSALYVGKKLNTVKTTYSSNGKIALPELFAVGGKIYTTLSLNSSCMNKG